MLIAMMSNFTETDSQLGVARHTLCDRHLSASASVSLLVRVPLCVRVRAHVLVTKRALDSDDDDTGC